MSQCLLNACVQMYAERAECSDIAICVIKIRTRSVWISAHITYHDKKDYFEPGCRFGTYALFPTRVLDLFDHMDCP